jgi:ParB-like chromosome segregation protein Spo0J
VKIHAVAHLFPPMSEAQYAALRDDIQENGQREPITLWRGQIIDGSHRARACQELNREPMVREWSGDESALIGYVVSLNLHRRHLNESQRAMVAAKITRDNVERQAARSPIGVLDGKVSQDEASRILNVSQMSITRARAVKARGIPELVEAVEAGDVSVARAAAVASLPVEQQRQVMEAPQPRNPHLNKHPTKGAMERVDRAVESLGNLSEVLVEVLPQMNGDKRRPVWASRLRDVRTTLTRFIVECERE